jgi:hypothetical protein
MWELKAETEDALVGVWKASNGSRILPIELRASKIDFDHFLPAEEIKSGRYTYKDKPRDENSIPFSEELQIKNMAGSDIYFDLYVHGPSPRFHVGYLHGMASMSGDYYYYKNEDGCKLKLMFSANTVKLDQDGTADYCGFGANISAYGTLTKKTSSH